MANIISAMITLLFIVVLAALGFNYQGEIELSSTAYWVLFGIVGMYSILPTLAVIGLLLIIANKGEAKTSPPRLSAWSLLLVASNTGMMLFAGLFGLALLYGGSNVIYDWLYQKHFGKADTKIDPAP